MIDRRANSVRSRPILTREHHLHFYRAAVNQRGHFRPNHRPTLHRASTRRSAMILIRFLRLGSATSPSYFADFIRVKIAGECKQREERSQHQQSFVAQ